MQVFFWIGPGENRNNKIFYQSFQLNGVNYNIGDSVYLFPENEHHPHYIGRIVSAFVDEHSGHADPHCIEVKWFERRVNLEEATRGIEESEREVFELEDVDINPIGCISGKNYVTKARAYDEAYQRMRGVTDSDWYFCRGYFLQTSNAFQPYSADELATRETELEEQESAAQSQPTSSSRAAQPASKRKATGRVCVQCGATSTPQWREGPTGPKTLCNACGVRYGRAQAKAQKRTGQSTAGASNRSQHGGAQSPHSQPAGRAASAPAHAGGASPPARTKKASKDADNNGNAQKVEQRPVRQAAQASLARTAAYARTGEFPDQEGLAAPQPHVRGRVGGISHDSSHVSPAIESGENGAFSSQTQLPIAALELPPAVAGLSAAEAQLATTSAPGGLHSAAAAKLMALSSMAPGAANPAEQVGVPISNSSPRLLATQHLGSPKAGASLLTLPGLLGAAPGSLNSGAFHGFSDSMPFSPSQLPGIAASDITSILGIDLPTSAGRGRLASCAFAPAGQDAMQSPAEAPGLDPAAPGVEHAAANPHTTLTPQAPVPQPTYAPDPKNVDVARNPIRVAGQTAALEKSSTEPQQTNMNSRHESSSTSQVSSKHQQTNPQSHSAIKAATPSPAAAALPCVALSPTAQLPNRIGAGLASPSSGGHPLLALLSGAMQQALAATAAPAVPAEKPQGEYQQLAVRAAKFLPELQAYAPMFAGLDALPTGSLPHEVSHVLETVREQVDTANKESAAAEAAVSAVTQVYSQRQQAAEQARVAATVAGQQLKEFLNSLISVHGLPVLADRGLQQPKQLGSPAAPVGAALRPGTYTSAELSHDMQPTAHANSASHAWAKDSVVEALPPVAPMPESHQPGSTSPRCNTAETCLTQPAGSGRKVASTQVRERVNGPVEVA